MSNEARFFYCQALEGGQCSYKNPGACGKHLTDEKAADVPGLMTKFVQIARGEANLPQMTVMGGGVNVAESSLSESTAIIKHGETTPPFAVTGGEVILVNRPQAK